VCVAIVGAGVVKSLCELFRFMCSCCCGICEQLVMGAVLVGV